MRASSFDKDLRSRRSTDILRLGDSGTFVATRCVTALTIPILKRPDEAGAIAASTATHQGDRLTAMKPVNSREIHLMPTPRQWWRPRFSLRTLAMLVTLICAYFAAWGATKRHVAREQSHGHLRSSHGAPLVLGTRALAPLLISRDILVLPSPTANTPTDAKVVGHSMTISDARTRYYVWLLGPTVELPYQANADPYTLSHFEFTIKSGDVEIRYQK